MLMDRQRVCLKLFIQLLVKTYYLWVLSSSVRNFLIEKSFSVELTVRQVFFAAGTFHVFDNAFKAHVIFA